MLYRALPALASISSALTRLPAATPCVGALPQATMIGTLRQAAAVCTAPRGSPAIRLLASSATPGCCALARRLRSPCHPSLLQPAAASLAMTSHSAAVVPALLPGAGAGAAVHRRLLCASAAAGSQGGPAGGRSSADPAAAGGVAAGGAYSTGDDMQGTASPAAAGGAASGGGSTADTGAGNPEMQMAMQEDEAALGGAARPSAGGAAGDPSMAAPGEVERSAEAVQPDECGTGAGRDMGPGEHVNAFFPDVAAGFDGGEGAQGGEGRGGSHVEGSSGARAAARLQDDDPFSGHGGRG